MAKQRITDSLFANIPDFDVVVYATRVELVAGFGECYGSDWERRLDECDRFFRPGVPELPLVSGGRTGERQLLPQCIRHQSRSQAFPRHAC